MRRGDVNYIGRKAALSAAASANALALCVGLQMTPSGAWAQSGRNSVDGGEDVIVVTAQKREQDIQSVPAAVSAFSGAEIEKKGIDGIEDLSRHAPSLNYTVLTPGEFRLSMRGLTTQYALAPVVAFYYDETPFDIRSDGFTGIPNIDLFDVERVEVLRGPQGSLFGSSSLGGAIRVIPKRPQLDELSALARFELSSTRDGGFNYSAKSAVNLPLGSTVAARINGGYSRNEGFIDRAPPSDYFNISAADPVDLENENDFRLGFAKISLDWSPDDSISIRPSVYYQKANAAGYSAMTSGSRRYVRGHTLPDENVNELAIYSLTAEKDFGPAVLTSATSYLEKNSASTNDYTVLASVIHSSIIGSIIGVPPQPMTSENPVTYDQFTQEVRVASHDEGAVSWIVGAYFSDVDQSADQLIRSEALGGFVSQLFGIMPPTDEILSFMSSVNDRQYAGFGELTYSVGPFDFTGGVRVYHFRQTLSSDQAGLFAGPTQPETTARATGANPRFNVALHADDGLLLYASASKGFRAGGPNAALVGAPGTCTFDDLHEPSYEPDSVWSYEVGEKVELANGRLTVNSAAYQIDWSNLQGPINSSCGLFNANFGDARVRGFETELVFQAVEQLTLSASASYNDAEIRELKPGFSAATGIDPGDRLVNVPRFQYRAGLDWSSPLSESIDAYFRADWQYVGSTPTNYTDLSPRFNRSSYHNLDLTAGLNIDNIDVAVFVANATNELQIVDITDWAPGFTTQQTLTAPRTIGARAAFDF